MTTTTAHLGAAPDSVRARGKSALVLALAAVLAPAVLLAGLATGGWWPLLLLAGVAGLCALSLADARSTVLVAVLLATFVDYTTGRLTAELAVVCAWLAWVALVLVWRSAWKGWVLPPREMLPGMAVWLGVVAIGTTAGLLQGYDPRNVGIELLGALWPLMGLWIMQLYGRRSLGYAALGLFAIALIHTGFGLTMLQIYQHRVGGIYFTTITGFVAVGLWTASILAPSRKIRVLCMAGMIPLLTHLLFSFTRGYWLGFLAGIVAASVLAWRSLGRFEPLVRVRRVVLLPALLFVFTATVGLSALYLGGERLLTSVGGRFSSSFSTRVSGETLSNLVRLDEYDRAIGAALQSPILGRGMGFAFITRDFLTRTIKDQWFVHNYYILLWLKLGLAGLLAFGFLVWSFMRAALRVARRDEDWQVRAWAIFAVAMTVDLLVILTTNYSLADVTTGSVVACVWGVFWSIRPQGGEVAEA